jgi:hypothetical protein
MDREVQPPLTITSKVGNLMKIINSSYVELREHKIDYNIINSKQFINLTR